MTDILRYFADPAVVWIFIPVVAIIGSFVYKGMKLYYDHQERMARIEMGNEN